MPRDARPVAVLCAVQFVDVLGVTMVITALPSMLAGVGASPSAAGLLVTGYAMCFGGLLMLGARAGDRFGHRRVLLAGLAAFAAGSLLAAVAGSTAVLVAGRCAQGAGAAASVPTALALLAVVAPEAAPRRRALAAWSAAGAVAGASGFLVGGLVTEVAGWRALFWADLPLAAGLAVLVRATVPPGRAALRERLDAGGAVLLTAGVMGLVLGASLLERGPTRGAGLAAAGVGAALLAGFAVLERRVRAPLVPAAAARHPRLRAGAGASFLNTATTSSAMTLVTLHLQGAAGLSPTAAGLRLVPFSLGVVAGAAAAAPALARRPPRAVIASGLGTIAVADAALLATGGAPGPLVPIAAAGGAGLGLSSVAATALGTAVGGRLQATASGLLNTAAQLGTALGIAALLLIASAC
jgi:predicted MFS family arabinose efflux permease